MAEIQQNDAGPAKAGKRRAKKMSTRIDMTPMVDLAFLLLTFFMLTTTFAKPNVMDLNMPVKGDDSEVSASNAMTILLGKHHQVHYYFGMNNSTIIPALQTTSFAGTGIRQAVFAFQKLTGGAPIVLIKPTADAQYRDIVDILDEMNITGQRKYALVKMTPDDVNLLKTTKPTTL